MIFDIKHGDKSLKSMSSKKRINIDESLTRGLEHKASQTNILYGKSQCHYCSKIGHVGSPCPNFHGKLQTKT